jgi:hypothetical protein
MVSVPTKVTSEQSSHQQLTQDSHERTPYNNARFQTLRSSKNLENQYSLTLLLGALISLAQDYSLKADTDVEFLVTKHCLESSLTIATVGLPVISDRVKRDYEWLLNVLESNTESIG